MVFFIAIPLLTVVLQSFQFKQELLETREREKCDPFGCETEIVTIPVLDDNGKIVGDWNPDLDTKTIQQALEYMLLLRIYDDRMLTLQRQGKLSFYMKSLGEEAVAIGSAMALRDDDFFFPL